MHGKPLCGLHEADHTGVVGSVVVGIAIESGNRAMAMLIRIDDFILISVRLGDRVSRDLG